MEFIVRGLYACTLGLVGLPASLLILLFVTAFPGSYIRDMAIARWGFICLIVALLGLMCGMAASALDAMLHDDDEG